MAGSAGRTGSSSSALGNSGLHCCGKYYRRKTDITKHQLYGCSKRSASARTAQRKSDRAKPSLEGWSSFIRQTCLGHVRHVRQDVRHVRQVFIHTPRSRGNMYITSRSRRLSHYKFSGYNTRNNVTSSAN